MNDQQIRMVGDINVMIPSLKLDIRHEDIVDICNLIGVKIWNTLTNEEKRGIKDTSFYKYVKIDYSYRYHLLMLIDIDEYGHSCYTFNLNLWKPTKNSLKDNKLPHSLLKRMLDRYESKICTVCQGTGISYWSDDIYGHCLECKRHLL